MSIKKKILLISGLLLALNILVSVGVLIRQNISSTDASEKMSAAMQTQIDNDAASQMKSIADNTALFLTELENTIDDKMLNSALVLQKLDTLGDVSLRDMENAAKETGVNDMYFSDMTGRFTLSTVDGATGFNLFDIWDGYRMLVTGDATILHSAIKIMEETGEIYKFTAIPRYDQNGRLKGIIESALNVESIERSLNQYMSKNSLIDGLYLIQAGDGLALTSNNGGRSKLAYKSGAVSQDAAAQSAAEANKPGYYVRDDGTLLYYIPIEKFGAPAYTLVVESSRDYFTKSAVDAQAGNDAIIGDFFGSAILNIIISFILALLIIICYIRLMMRLVLNPIKKVAEASTLIADGESEVQLDTARNDEIGVLTKSFQKVVDSIQAQSVALKSLAAGDFSVAVHERSERDVISKAMNHMAAEQKKYVKNISDVMAALSQGDLNANVDIDYHGDFLPIKQAINGTISTLRGIITTISGTLAGVSAGDLGVRIKEDFSGDFGEIKTSINNMALSLNTYVSDISNEMRALESGSLDVKLTARYDGDFKPIETAFIGTMAMLKAYIQEITNVLSAMADKDFTHKLGIRFKGDFAALEASIRQITFALKDVMSGINVAADQVAAGSSQVADGAQVLAQGANDQLETINSLLEKSAMISENAHAGEDKAVAALRLSETAQITVTEGTKSIGFLTEAMDEIKASSSRIERIVKTIEDIAFQTNLLALNAAVEAARAGEAGKGFTVVADQVRHLATKSADATKDIAELIHASAASVEKGGGIVKQTSALFDEIVAQTRQITEITGNIAGDIRNQATGIESVSAGVNDMSKVVSSNAAISQESAASGQELSSQSQTLKELIGSFRL